MNYIYTQALYIYENSRVSTQLLPTPYKQGLESH